MLEKFWGQGLNGVESRYALTYLYDSYTFLGINPPKKLRKLFFFYAFMQLSICAIIAPITCTLSLVLDENNKNMPMEQLLTALQAAVNILGIPIKIAAVALSFHQLRSCEVILAKLDARCENPTELAYLRRAIVFGNRAIVLFVGSYNVYSSTTVGVGVTMGQPPLSLYSPFWNWRNSTTEFWLQIVCELILLFYLCYHQAVNDCYAVIYIYIMRTHLQMLVKRVERLGTNPEVSDEEHYNELVNCIRDHQHLLEIFDIISPIVSITVFVQFIATAVVFSLTLINILIFADTSTQIGAVSYVAAVTIQTAPCCYQATYLMEDSDKLPLAIFHCNWMEQDKRFRKMLIFFMQRAQKTITFSALKLFPINLNTFVSVTKFSFSLYTLAKESDFSKNYKQN